MHTASPRALAALLSVLSQFTPTTLAQFTELAQVLVTVRGAQAGDLFGWHVRLAGDVNRDGITDFAIASPFHDLNQGRVSMHSGRDGSELWSQQATVASAVLGFELQTLSDIDSDGVREVIASAPFAGTGVVYVYSGRTGAILRTLRGFGNNLGYAIATDGDFDGDGVLDVAIGATADATSYPDGGRVYVLTTATFATVATIEPPAGEFNLGTALAFLGDVDRDGRDDLVVGSRLSSTGTSGKLHVVTLPVTTPVFRTTITGVEHGSSIDTNHARPGRDFDGDSVPDIYYGEGWPPARARIFSGSTGSVLRTFTDLPGDGLGTGGQGMIDDLNGDGFPEVLVGAPSNQVNAPRNGRITLFSGRDGRRLRTFTHTAMSALLGSDAQLLPDRTNDGVPEILLAARGLGPGFSTPPTFGQVYIVAGEGCLAGWRNYGAGLAGRLGVPSLVASSDPSLGTTTQISIGNAAGAATAALLAAGNVESNVPSPWGGTILVVPQVAVPLTLAVAGATLPFTIPPAPVFCGVDVRAQAFLLDSAAVSGVAETRGLHLRLGR